MRYLLDKGYIRRLQTLRQRLERSIRNVEVQRVSPSGSVILPEPESHRPYTPGDNPNYIDWNLFARTDRYFVKSMLREEEGTLTLLLDVSSSMLSPFPRKIEAAQELAGAISYLSLCAGNQVRVAPWSDQLAPIRRTFMGERSAMDMLKNLSSLPEKPTGARTDLQKSLGQVLSEPDTEGSWFLIISDFIDLSPYENLLKSLSLKSGNIGAIQVLHPEEINPTVRGNLMLVDPETGLERNRVLGHRSLREARKIVRSFIEETRKAFKDNGGSFTTISSQEPFEDAVMSFLTGTGTLTL